LSAGKPASQLAGQPAVIPGSTSDMTPDFTQKKVIVSSLQNCYFDEGSSTAPWSFLLSVTSFLSLPTSYKNTRNL